MEIEINWLDISPLLFVLIIRLDFSAPEIAEHFSRSSFCTRSIHWEDDDNEHRGPPKAVVIFIFLYGSSEWNRAAAAAASRSLMH